MRQRRGVFRTRVAKISRRANYFHEFLEVYTDYLARISTSGVPGTSVYRCERQLHLPLSYFGADIPKTKLLLSFKRGFQDVILLIYPFPR